MKSRAHPNRRPGSLWALLGVLVLIAVPEVHGWQTPPAKHGIHVTIGGLRSDKGQVLCSLFATAADFPRNIEKAVATTKSNISHGQAVCEFSDVVPGRYAVSVFHDENSDGKLNRNFMGIPREGVGASNNAIGHFGPPKFDDAAFLYSGGVLDLKITVAYI